MYTTTAGDNGKQNTIHSGDMCLKRWQKQYLPGYSVTDDLSAARGIFIGCCIGGVLWLAILGNWLWVA